jgi:hypothetical protein
VDHEYYVATEIKLIPKRMNEAALFEVAVSVRTGIRNLIRISLTDQIAGNQPTEPSAGRHDVAPEIGRGRITVRKDNGIAFALVDIGHSLTIDGHKLLLGEGRVAQVHRYDPPADWNNERCKQSLPCNRFICETPVYLGVGGARPSEL